MKVLITGGTGLIGSRLQPALMDRGDEVIVASRSKTGENYVQWDPFDADSLDIPSDTDAVVHLAGAPVFGQRWNEQYKREIRRSRVQGTKTVVKAIDRSDAPINTLISSSAVGYYGDRGDDTLDEEAGPGDDFLADVCKDWESVAKKFDRESDVNVSIIRTGIVLSTEGGALQRMLNPFAFFKPFHWGLGGPLGWGTHFMPWIHIEDEVKAILHLLDNKSSGVFNFSAPNPVRNKKLTAELGTVLSRPTLFPLPYIALRILFGPAASILFASQRVVPSALEAEGYEFKYPRIKEALQDLLA